MIGGARRRKAARRLRLPSSEIALLSAGVEKDVSGVGQDRFRVADPEAIGDMLPRGRQLGKGIADTTHAGPKHPVVPELGIGEAVGIEQEGQRREMHDLRAILTTGTPQHCRAKVWDPRNSADAIRFTWFATLWVLLHSSSSRTTSASSAGISIRLG